MLKRTQDTEGLLHPATMLDLADGPATQAKVAPTLTLIDSVWMHPSHSFKGQILRGTPLA